MNFQMKNVQLKNAEPKAIGDFDILFGEAVDELTKYGRLISDYDSEYVCTRSLLLFVGPHLFCVNSRGNMYLASDHEVMSWNCRATVAVRNSWVEWRSKIFGMEHVPPLSQTFSLDGGAYCEHAGAIGAVLVALYLRAQSAVRSAEARRVSELVQIALDELRNQELAHHTDPVTAPQPYLSSLQLRDLILQDEHSVPKRSRLWDRVERIVESNANVRANLEELRGGDEARVWRWVGSSGLISPSKRAQHGQTPYDARGPGTPVSEGVGASGRIVA